MARNDLNIRAFGLTGGILWSVSVFIFGVIGMYGIGLPLIQIMDAYYIGFEPNFIGSIIGAFWGFIDGFVGCALFAWIYNKLK